MVRTSSGDWAEACTQEAHRVQESQKQEASDPSPQASSAAPSHSRCHSCFTSPMCLGDDGSYEPLVDAPTAGANPAAQSPPTQLHCCTPDEGMTQRLRQLIGNHVPQQTCRSIRWGKKVPIRKACIVAGIHAFANDSVPFTGMFTSRVKIARAGALCIKPESLIVT